MEWILFIVVLGVIMLVGSLIDRVTDGITNGAVGLLALPFRGVKRAMNKSERNSRTQRVYFDTSLPPHIAEETFLHHFRDDEFSPANKVTVLEHVPGRIVIGIGYADGVMLTIVNTADPNFEKTVPAPTEPVFVGEICLWTGPRGAAGTFRMLVMPEDPDEMEKVQIDEIPIYSLGCLHERDQSLVLVGEKDAVARGLIPPRNDGGLSQRAVYRGLSSASMAIPGTSWPTGQPPHAVTPTFTASPNPPRPAIPYPHAPMATPPMCPPQIYPNPTQQTPAQQTPAQQTPVQQVPVQQVPVPRAPESTPLPARPIRPASPPPPSPSPAPSARSDTPGTAETRAFRIPTPGSDNHHSA